MTLLRKHLLLLGIAVLLTAAGLTIATDKADAAVPTEQVTRAEFNSIKGGMTLDRVSKILDTRGAFEFQGDNIMSRTYDGWGPNVTVAIIYKRHNGAWRVGYDRWGGAWKSAFHEHEGTGGHD
jgi:hypothetical protein